MTREIKFRAKIVMDIESLAMKKGYWVEGHYYEDLQDSEWCSWIQECNDIIHYKVDKNTLGQFTGLLDKNGKEIYEGDIMRIPETEFNIEIIGVVEFDRGSYVVRSFFSGTYSSLAWAIRERQSGEQRGVVIGNIHDNPELLKTETL